MRSAGIQSNRRAQWAPKRGRPGCRLPLSVFCARSPAMTLSGDVGRSTQRGHSIPVLETKRLTLRAPRHEDVKAIAVLANDRRIAENTTRIPHPYRLADAEEFVANVNRRVGEACFVLMLDGTLIGACGIDPRDEGAELGYWLRAGPWGPRGSHAAGRAGGAQA